MDKSNEMPTICGRCYRALGQTPWCADCRRYRAEHDDDPYCVCGVARSEHALCGCREGFQTHLEWAAERAAIALASDEPDVDDEPPADVGAHDTAVIREWEGWEENTILAAGHDGW